MCESDIHTLAPSVWTEDSFVVRFLYTPSPSKVTMAEESSVNASMAYALKKIEITISGMGQKFLDVDKVMNNLQATQVSLSRNLSTMQSRVQSLGIGISQGVQRNMFSSPESLAQNKTGGQTTPSKPSLNQILWTRNLMVRTRLRTSLSKKVLSSSRLLRKSAANREK